MRVRARILACALAAASAADLVAQAPPPAPDGFSWKSIESVKASFLIPTGWHFRKEEHDGARAFFITQEEIVGGGQYETGLSVNVQKLKKDPAPERAAQFIAALVAANEGLDSWKRQQGALEACGCRLRIREKGQPPLVEQVLAIGNRRTNTLYILIFESPEKKWPAAWEKGEVMLKEFLLDDEV